MEFDRSNFCAYEKCGGYIHPQDERRFRIFRGKKWHTECLIKETVDLLGNMFYKDMEMLRFLRGREVRD